ncbi:ankyrin-3-like, partial [Limulus polyphemus]|uniref:Ankyrin-3-like n=1 Tax=Limulus polyphemus TaxID=6850 RepID=A0ABM1SDN9_LIMPO
DNLTALHIAIQAGKWEVLETLLGHGANVNLSAGKNGATPLHLAATIPSGEKSAELLIKSGANINASQKGNETPLHLAVRHGNLRTVELLLEDGAQIQSQTEFGETALHIGVKNCRFQVVKCLLTYWASTFSGQQGLFSVNQQNQKGETALHYAAALTPNQHHYVGESRDIVKILLQNGGNVTMETTEWKETPLHYCSRAGNVESMRVILESLEPSDLQALSNRKSKNGWSPLLYASNGGHFDVVNLLIQNNARVDVFDEHGKAALHLAAENGHQEIVDLLIHHKAFVNVRSKKGFTSLHLAARNGHNAIVRDLIRKYGSMVDAFSLTKQTALHLAAERGNLDVCNTLLDANANASSIDNDGQSPLLLAAQNDHSEVVKLFLRHQPQLVSVANTVSIKITSVSSSRTKKTNETALHLAADSGHAKVVRDLLKAGASPSEENADGNTALHLAAKQGHLGVLEELKTAVNWKIKSKKTGLTALHVAAIHGRSDFVREMLTQVPAAILSDPPSEENSALDDDGYTPLHLAAQFGRENVVRMLLNSDGVRTDTPTTTKGTIPLHLAAQGGHMSVVGLLLSRGTELLQATDRIGRTPLHLAAANGHKDMLGLLLGQNADINAADNNGWTALHYTACRGFLEAVQFLIESGASSLSKTKDGKVSLSFAAANGHHEVLSFLLRAPHDSYNLMEDKAFLMDLMTCAKTHNNRPMLEFVLLSPAPIEIAVKVARQYQNLALKEKERYCDLEYMSSFCDNIASDLMTVTAASNLTPTLLRALDVNQTAFMDVLIEQERKEVVSHPSVQKYLTELWMGGIDWPQWRIVLLFLVFLLFPIVWILCSLPFGHRLPNIPIIKFLSYLISHIFFVVLLSFTIINPWVPLWRNTNLIPQWHEGLLIVWVAGMVLSHIANPKEKGGFAWTRVIVMFFCMLSILVHCSAIFILEIDTKLILLYIRNQLLGVSLLLCFLEFLNFLSFHHLFGPWAVIIKDLMKDLLRFLAILALFLVGFSLHLSAIYQPVFEPIYLTNASLPTFGQEFQSPINTFEMLFFALFGLVEPDYMPPLYLSPSFSKIIIKVVFGVYMTVTVVVLINLLIAMMSNTYQRIQARSDTEWKFGRAKLIRRMIRTSSSPPPVNFFTGFWFMIRKCRRFKVRKAQTVRPKERTLSVNIPAPVRPVISKGARRRWQMALTSVGATRSGIEASVFELRENTIARVVDWPPIVAKFLQTKGIVDMSPVFRKE